MASKRSLIVFGIGRRNHLLDLMKFECHRHGINLIGCDIKKVVSGAISTDKFIRSKSINDFYYIPSVIKIIDNNNCIGFTTIVDPEIIPLGEISLKKSFKSPTIYLNPSPQTAKLCEDKLLFYKYLSKRDVPVLKTELHPSIPYPFISKDRFGSCGSNLRTHHDPSSIIENVDNNRVFQPRCIGEHYCIDAYFDIFTGELIDFCVKKVLEKKDGESLLLELVAKEGFIDFIKKLENILALKGIVNLDVYKENGNLILCEINARIGGNYPVSHLAGVNLLRSMLNQLVGLNTEMAFDKQSYTPGSIFGKSYYLNKLT